jgi:hypothetical protein
MIIWYLNLHTYAIVAAVVMIVIVWQLDLQLLLQTVRITTNAGWIAGLWVFNTTFNNISVILFVSSIGGENRSTLKKASTLSYNVVLSRLRHNIM